MAKASNSGVEKWNVQLSCEQCQTRKKKCDKAQPCGACQRAKLDCTAVRRRPLPRGRTAPGKQKDSALRDQVARLESLVSGFASSDGANNVYTNGHAKDRDGALHVSVDDPKSQPRIGVKNSIWAAVEDHVVGIRDALNLEFPDNDSEGEHQKPSSSIQNFDIILFGVSSCAINPSIMDRPLEPNIYALFTTYVHRVDPIYKILHVPSLRSLVLAERQEEEDSPRTNALDALRFAIYFTAVCTLNKEECRQMLREDQRDLRNRLRLATEVSLSRANLQTTREIIVLQAFAIYLVGRRVCSDHKDITLLIACAVRLGHKIGLDIDKPCNATFEQEIRRRLWYSICILDMQAALDGGMRATITNCDSKPPKRINDADISPNTSDHGVPPAELRGFVDMSFSSMTHEALVCWRKLSYSTTDTLQGFNSPGAQDWTVRSGVLKSSEIRLRETYLQYCDMSQPFHRFTKLCGEGMIVTLQLLERRPLHGILSRGSPPPDDFDIMQVATDILDASLMKREDQTLAPWSWFSWCKWYALAVLLAELCDHNKSIRTDRAWHVAEASFPQITDTIIDESLSRSLQKLMTKAQSVRDGRRSLSQSHTSVTCVGNSTSSDLRQMTGMFPIPDESLYSTKHQQTQNHESDTGALGNLGPPIQQVNPSASLELLQDSLMDYEEELAWVNWEAFIHDIENSNDGNLLI
ncbi:hypothetical protein ACLMJK_005260 [Lecanora helva]